MSSKTHKILSFAIGILFIVVLQTFAAPRPVYRFLLPAFFAYLLAVTLYNRWYLRSIGKYNFWVMARPILLMVSAFGIFWFLPNDFLKGIFLILSACIAVFVEFFLGNFSENILLNETLLIAFGWFMALFGNSTYYPKFHNLYLVAVFGATWLVTRAFYEFIPQSFRSRVISSLAMSLFATEVFWALSFLPLHYSALALIQFNLFYFCIILNYYYVYMTLSVKKIQYHFLLMAVASGLIFLVTPWKILK